MGGSWKDTQNSWKHCTSLISLENYAKREVLSPPLKHMHTDTKHTADIKLQLKGRRGQQPNNTEKTPCILMLGNNSFRL